MIVRKAMARGSPGQQENHTQNWFLANLNGVKHFIVAEGLKNDPLTEHKTLLQLFVSAVRKKRRHSRTSNYWILLESPEKEELLAGLLIGEERERVSAPAPENIRRLGGAPFLFEIRKRGKVRGKVVAVLRNGKLECYGDTEALRLFLARAS